MYICAPVCGFGSVSTGTCRDQRRALDPHGAGELELQAAASCQIWVPHKSMLENILQNIEYQRHTTLPSGHRVPGPGAPSSLAIPWLVQRMPAPADGTQLSWLNVAGLGLHPLPPNSSPLNSLAVLTLGRRPARGRHANMADRQLFCRMKPVMLVQGSRESSGQPV